MRINKKTLGRPTKQKTVNKELRTIYITQECWEFFKNLGDGNFSKGVAMSRDLLNKKYIVDLSGLIK